MKRITWPAFRFGPINLHSLLDAYTFYRLREGRRPPDAPVARPPWCEATQHSDQMHCSACGATWDVNDPEPPFCPR